MQIKTLAIPPTTLKPAADKLPNPTEFSLHNNPKNRGKTEKADKSPFRNTVRNFDKKQKIRNKHGTKIFKLVYKLLYESQNAQHF